MWAGGAAGCVLLQCLSLASWGQGIAMAWPHTAHSEEVLSPQAITLGPSGHILWGEFVLIGEKRKRLIKKKKKIIYFSPAQTVQGVTPQRGESSGFPLPHTARVQQLVGMAGQAHSAKPQSCSDFQ